MLDNPKPARPVSHESKTEFRLEGDTATSWLNKFGAAWPGWIDNAKLIKAPPRLMSAKALAGAVAAINGVGIIALSARNYE
jgi:hypothetical protein